MPPKRKAAAKKATAAAPAAKKARGKRAAAAAAVVEEEEEEEEDEPEAGPSDIKKAIEQLKKADAGKKKTHKKDSLCNLNAEVSLQVVFFFLF